MLLLLITFQFVSKLINQEKIKKKLFYFWFIQHLLYSLVFGRIAHLILIRYFIYLENPKIIIKCVATEAYPGFFHQGQIQVLVGGAEIFSSGAESRPKG